MSDRVLFTAPDEVHATNYCIGDYVTWSVPVEDLSDWRCEGVIFRKGAGSNDRARQVQPLRAGRVPGPRR